MCGRLAEGEVAGPGWVFLQCAGQCNAERVGAINGSACLLTVHIGPLNAGDLLPISCTNLAGEEVVALQAEPGSTIGDLQRRIAAAETGRCRLICESGQVL